MMDEEECPLLGRDSDDNNICQLDNEVCTRHDKCQIRAGLIEEQRAASNKTDRS